MKQDWNEKYRPKTTSELVGNRDAITEVVEYLKDYQNKDPVIMHGPPGVGKTTCVYTIAEDLGYDIYEINASEERNKSELEEGKFLKAVTSSGWMPDDVTVTFVDEVDNLDRGGSGVIKDGIDETNQPIVFSCNDLYGVSKSIRNRCNPVEFETVSNGNMLQRLISICDDEDIPTDKKSLKRICELADGDMRVAVRELADMKYQLEKEWLRENITLPDDYEGSVSLIGPSDFPEEDTRDLLELFQDRFEDATVFSPLLPGFSADAVLWLMENTDAEIYAACPFNNFGMADIWEDREDDWKWVALQDQIGGRLNWQKPMWNQFEDPKWYDYSQKFMVGSRHSQVLGIPDDYGIWMTINTSQKTDLSAYC